MFSEILKSLKSAILPKIEKEAPKINNHFIVQIQVAPMELIWIILFIYKQVAPMELLNYCGI